MDDQQKRLLEELLFSGEKKLSFAKMLYFGAFHSPSVFPFPEVSQESKQETEAFVEKLKTFIHENIDPDQIDRQAQIPDQVIQGLGRIGMLGLTIPKEDGGSGLSQYTYCRAMEELSRHCGSTALFVNAHQSVGLKALVLFGTDEQRKKYLPKLASGEHIAAFSLTEPNAGSDASGVETRAEYLPEQKSYRINGKKQWTTNGGIADVLTVMAQTEIQTPQGKEDKVTAFIVTPDMPGFHVENVALEKVGMRGTKTANLSFENVVVPEENILGPLGGGLKVCLTVLDYGRTTFGATCTGSAKFLVERSMKHAQERKQFKRSLSSFPLVKKKLAVMNALVYAMESTTYLTAGLVDRGMEEFMLEAAILKVFNSDSLWSILYDTMQIFGGRSFFTDEPFERMMRDARLNTIGEGSNEVLRAFIALVGIRDVGMQFKNASEAIKHPFSKFGDLLSLTKVCRGYICAPSVPIQSPDLKYEAKQLGKATRRFAVSIAKLLKEHQEQVVEQQLSLDRIADAAMALYTATAVLSRLDSQIQKSSDKAMQNELATGKFYCRLAFQTIDCSLNTLFSNHDSEIENLSDQLTGACS